MNDRCLSLEVLSGGYEQNLYESGTTVTFRGTGGGDVLWTPQNEALGKGRISAVWDRGAGAHPLRYLWRMRTRWVATAAAGDMMRLYLIQASAAADPSQTDGGFTFGDAELSSEVALYQQTQYLGLVISSGVSQVESSSGGCEIYERYVGIAMWNGSGTKALTNTVTDHIFTLTELPDEVEAAA